MHYHVWHDERFNDMPPFGTVDLNIPVLYPDLGGDPWESETRTFQSLRNDMAKLRADGAAKGIVDDNVESVGFSTELRALWALKIGKGEDHKILFTGCHHAREWISVEVPYLIAKYLIDTYKDTPNTDQEKRIKHLLDNRQIWFVPMVNPDGHQFTITNNRMWRSNRNCYVYPKTTIIAPQLSGGPPRHIKLKPPAGKRVAEYCGVDINRNYPTADGGKEAWCEKGVTTSRDPRDTGIWAGPFPGSEKETSVIASLVAEQQFRASITYHNYSQLLLFPHGAAAKEDSFLQDVGNGMSHLINANGNPYTYEAIDKMYPTTGELENLCYEKLPGRPTFTVELPPLKDAPKCCSFSGLPEDKIEPTFKENLGAALALINSAGFDAPPKGVKIAWSSKTKVAQVVRNCWKVFEGWKPPSVA